MECISSDKSPHCLIVTYPTVGHINPMLQFSKRLEHKGANITLVLTEFMKKKTLQISRSIAVETISDGYDEGGIAEAENTDAYLDRFWRVSPQTLTKLLEKLSKACDNPVSCVIYDAFLPWVLDVAKSFGLVGAVFFTQSCAVDSIYYHINRGLLKIPVESETISIPGLPALSPLDLPSFASKPDSYPSILRMVVDQLSYVDRADWVLCNSFYELEEEVINWMTKILPSLRTIGPTIPSMYLDKQLEGDTEYDLITWNPNTEKCLEWLNSSPKRSVVYVSFGSLVEVKAEQIEEVACWLKRSEFHFLWVIRDSESKKLPKGFVEETRERGNLVISWCPQLEVLANDVVGCFVTHCGWNSTLEALCLGVPMIAIPQWSDQTTNAKHIADIWKVGVKPQADVEGIVRRDELERSVEEIMVNEKGKEMRMNAIKLSQVAKKTVNQGGTSDKNIGEFISNIVKI